MDKGKLIVLGIMAFLLIMTFYFINAGFAESHERHEYAHVKFNDYFGVESHVVWGEVGGMSKIVYDSQISKEDRPYLLLAHSFNEAIGYQLKPLFYMLAGLLAIVIMLLCFILIVLATNGKKAVLDERGVY